MIPTLKPTWKQHLAYEKLKDNTTEYVTFGGGAGGGKSWLGCEYLLRNATSFPGTTYFIGRSELKQLRKSTVPTLYKVCDYHNIKRDSLFKFNGQDQCFYFKNGSRIDLIDLKYLPSDPLYERFGSLEYTQGWVEEAREVHEDAANMISSRTGRQHNDKYGLLGKTLITCNPKKNWLYYQYYLPHRNKVLASNKAFIKALVTDNTYGESGYVKKLEGFKGITLQRLRFGIWEYDADPSALIGFEAISRIFKPKPLLPVDHITVDVARYGPDSTVIGLWRGKHVDLYRYINLSIKQTAEKIRIFAERHKVPMHRVLVDADGVGGGVVDILDCRQFVNNSRPFPSPVNPNFDEETGEPIPENYRSLKAQCAFRTAEDINNGIITVEIINTGLETDEAEQARLTEDLEQVKAKDIDSDGKLDVLGKKDIKLIIGRSTDYWDCISMRKLFDLDPEPQI